MTQTNVQLTSTSGPLAGPWQLSPGRAWSLRAERAGLVRVLRGVVWATVDGPHEGPGNEYGDYVLEAGEMIMLRAGERLVLEPARSTQDAHIEWRPAAEGAGALASAAAASAGGARRAPFGRAWRAVAAWLARFGATGGGAPA